MYVPKTDPEREKKIRYIVDVCTETQPQRALYYAKRRQWTLFGAEANFEQVLYNKLMAHTDLVSSFLYAADHCTFTVAAPVNADDPVVDQLMAVQDHWNDEFLDSGLAYQFQHSIFWSLCYDSMFLKFGWNDSRDQLFAHVVPPHCFGVYDESESDLDSQQAFVHTYTIDWDDACLRMIRAGLGDKIDQLHATTVDSTSSLPAPLQGMISNGMRTSVSDPLIGQAGMMQMTAGAAATYAPKVDTTRVQIHDVWIWDDAAVDEDGEPCGDYVQIQYIEPGCILSDSRERIAVRKKAGMKRWKSKLDLKSLRWTDTNDFMADEHPFVHVRPFEVYDYFWGESHTERLIPLQNWINVRLWQIHQLLEMQVDPPKSFMGMMGLSDEKADALGGPGTWVMDMNPGAKVENLTPEMPPDLFHDYEQISLRFDEASGLTQTVTGKGEQGVRGRGHAKQLATTGSSRIRKTAVGLEPALIRAGDLGLKLKARNSTNKLRTDKGMDFYLSQVAIPYKMRVAGHSHSPLFADESRDLAGGLFKAQAIDGEDLIRMLRPPGEANLIHKFRKRNAAKQRLIQQHPELLAKAGKGKKPNGLGAIA